MCHVKAECEFSLTGNYPSPKIMACNFEVAIIGEESEGYILSPTSCLTDERTLIRASRLASYPGSSPAEKRGESLEELITCPVTYYAWFYAWF